MQTRGWLIIVLLTLFMLLSACSGNPPTPTSPPPTATATATARPTTVPTSTPTVVPTATMTSTPTPVPPTATTAPTLTPTALPTMTATAPPAPTSTRSPVPPTATAVVTGGIPDGPGTPTIELTTIPPYGDQVGLLQGRVLHVDPARHRVCVVIMVNGGWWNKPYFASPTVTISSQGTWEVRTNTGGRDFEFTEVRAFILAAGVEPPQLANAATESPELAQLEKLALARVVATRTRR